MRTAARFVCDTIRSITWQTLLLTQVLALAIDAIAVLSFVLPFRPPSTFLGSRVVVDETMALSIVLAVLAADQAVARGARLFRAYALAILIASLSASAVQFEVRHWLGLYTNGDQPGRPMSQRRMQMVYAASDTLTYGALFVLIYLDYRRRERMQRRVREAELERARKDQRLAESGLAALRSEVDAEELMATLAAVQHLFEQDSPLGERRLDELIADLRARLTSADTAADVRVHA